MKAPNFNIFIVFLALLVAGCEDEPVQRDYPRVRTLEVTSITEEGATFTAEVYDEGNVSITEHGFTWSYFKPDVNSSEKVFLGSFEGTGSFKTDILTALTSDGVYRVSAFVKAGDYTVYGNEVTFTSLGSSGPVITGFEPSTVECGDTVVIRGRNFSYVSNKTFIDDMPTYNSTLSDSVLKIVVPYSLTKVENIVSVEVAGNRSHYTAEKLWVNIPKIASISPLQAYWGDTILLELLNLRSGKLLSVALGSIALTPLEPYDGSRLRIIVPATLASSETPVVINIPERTIVSPTPFSLLPPVIDSISPLCGNWSSIVTLYGHFNPTLTGTTVSFMNIKATIQSHTRDSIIVSIPPTLTTASNITYKYGVFQAASVQQFSFLPPEILTVTPLSDYVGGVVTITGRNFSLGNTSVIFGDITATNISVTENEVKCYVPGNISGPANLTVRAGALETVFTDQFLLTNPTIISFYPESGTIGDTILIKCANLLPNTLFTLGNYVLTNISTSHDTVKAWLSRPYTIESGYLSTWISRNGVSSFVPSGQIFTAAKPEIQSFLPMSGKAGTLVTVRGANFSKVMSYNFVQVNGVYKQPLSVTSNEIIFHMPSFNQSADYAITVTVGEKSVTSDDKFSYASAWTRLPNLPAEMYHFPYSFPMKFGNEVVVAASPGSDIYEKVLFRFDQLTGSFSRLNDSVYRLPFYEAAVIIKGTSAFLLGYGNNVTTIYSFDNSSQVFEKVSDFPGQAYRKKVFLDGDSVLYVGGGNETLYKTDFWKYSLQTGRWTQLSGVANYSCHPHEFTVGGRCFVVSNNKTTYEYNPIADNWIPHATYSGSFCMNNVCVECDGLIYMGLGSCGSSSLNLYDPVANVWTNLGYPIESLQNYLNFSIDGKIYIGGGQGGSVFWECDPAMLDDNN